VFQVNPEYNTRSSKAFSMPSNGTTGAILPLEAIFNNNAFLNGQYKVGWYYDTSNAPKIGSTQKSNNRTGAYVLIDQAIWRDEQDPQSVLRLFGQAASSNAATSPMRRWYSVGLVKQKPFASRPNDSISFGYGARRAQLAHTRCARSQGDQPRRRRDDRQPRQRRADA
jgi:porin